jgi:hypothetical protein
MSSSSAFSRDSHCSVFGVDGEKSKEQDRLFS